MNAPDRPTREQVDAALVYTDDWGDNYTKRLAVEVRALRAELEAVAPLPAVPDGEGRQADADLDGRPLQPVTEALLVLAGEQLHRAIAAHDHPARQAIADVADWLRGKLGDPGTGWPVRAALSPVSDGDDVPARLDAAAEALEALHSHGLGYELRQVADQLRDGDGGTPELRAAVAAALALPTEPQK